MEIIRVSLDNAVKSTNQLAFNAYADEFFKSIDHLRGQENTIVDLIATKLDIYSVPDKAIQNALRIVKRLIQITDYFEAVCRESFATTLFELLISGSASADAQKQALEVIKLLATDQELV